MSSALFDLSGQGALVSGAASGLGRAMSLGLAGAGADLVLADLDGEGIADTASRIEAVPSRVLPVVCDVGDVEQIRALFNRADAEFGRLDVVGNVGGEGIRKDPLALTEEEIQQSLQNLLVGRLFCCQEAGRRMLAAALGSIINFVSIAGISALGCNHMAYSMAMGGVAQMTRELRTEWSSAGVRVNAIVCAR